MRSAGSSPLARGLRWLWVGRADLLGIIPARAGFTSMRDRRHTNPADHPRSRGVYADPGPLWCGRPGSSPLARGLHAAARPLDRPSGIIPARAGFTKEGRPTRGGPPDHPRSRGVYTGWTLHTLRHRGSSPLARGLRNEHRGHHHQQRIIPARAGFTAGRLWPIIVSRDHPRSRGVY